MRRRKMTKKQAVEHLKRMYEQPCADKSVVELNRCLRLPAVDKSSQVVPIVPVEMTPLKELAKYWENFPR